MPRNFLTFKAAYNVRSDFSDSIITINCIGTGAPCTRTKGKAVAWVDWTDLTDTINLCPAFFTTSKTPEDDQVQSQQGIFMHEMHHFMRLGGADDCDDAVDGTQDLAKKLAKNNPNAAITCANNYEWFATSHPGAACSVHRRSLGGAGEGQDGRRAAIFVLLFGSLIVMRTRRRLVKSGLAITLVLLGGTQAWAGEPPGPAQKGAPVDAGYTHQVALYHNPRIPPATWKREKPKAHGEATLPADQRFECVLEAASPSVVAGAPMKVRFRVRNISSSEVRVLERSTPLAEILLNDSFRIVGPDGKELAYGGPRAKLLPVDANDYQSIGAGQSVATEMDLYEQGYKVDELGEYKIGYVGRWNTMPAFDGKRAHLVCNTITISVTRAP